MLKIFTRKIVYTLVLLASGVTIVRAQFDTNIFTRKAPYWPESVVYMGDQTSMVMMIFCSLNLTQTGE
ncbi:MAG: hypothetical protein IPG53_17100 [Ignavibacteriales bacterium]|nr:hypothetical protein [Ignavibacteriales bacterium]